MADEQALPEVSELPLGRLLEGCQQRQPDNSHEAFCFELFRPAIVEKSEPCWFALYQQYKKLLYSWTLQFAKTPTRIGAVTIEEMVADAFTAFWRAFTPAKLNKAGRLASILAYLKACTATA